MIIREIFPGVVAANKAYILKTSGEFPVVFVVTKAGIFERLLQFPDTKPDILRQKIMFSEPKMSQHKSEN